MRSITISDWFEFFLFVIVLLLYRKSSILGLSFLDPKDICLSLTWCQRRNWVDSMIEWMLIFINLSYVCRPRYDDMKIFWLASLSKLPWRFWTEFSQTWNKLRKILWSHENLWSLTDLSGANIGFHSKIKVLVSECSWCQKLIH